MKRLHERWLDSYSKEAKYLADKANLDPFQQWQRDRNPEIACATRLDDALCVLCGGGPRSVADKMLESVVKLAGKSTEREDLIASSLRHAIVIRCQQFALGFLHGEASLEELLRAAELLIRYTSAKKGGAFDAQQQGYFLSAIRLMLALGDSEKAVALLEKRSSFKAHSEETAVLRRIAIGDTSFEVADDLDAVFDEVRDPATPKQRFVETPLGILEIALLRDRLFVAPGKPLQWKRLIEAIAT